MGGIVHSLSPNWLIFLGYATNLKSAHAHVHIVTSTVIITSSTYIRLT
jgi:hypothetical protein